MDEALTPTLSPEESTQEQTIGDYKVLQEEGKTTIRFHSVIHGQAPGELGKITDSALLDPQVKKLVFDLKGVHTADAVALAYFALACRRATGQIGKDKGHEKEVAFLDVEPVFMETLEKAGLGGFCEFSEPPKE